MLTDDIDKSNNELINILQEIDQIKDKKSFVILILIDFLSNNSFIF
jgi:hypothetical protein